MTAPSYPRELVLLNDVTILAAAAQSVRSPRAPYSSNPRFQLVISDIVTSGADPQIHINIEHGIDSTKMVKLFDGFHAQAAGNFECYVEDCLTKWPFPLLRANVTLMQDVTSFKARLVGVFDEE